MDFDKKLDLHRVEDSFEWRKWAEEIPFIKWPSDWEVKAIPPFAGAIIRYHIKTKNCKSVSVYLDCYDCLGFVNQPYWEVYPIDNDCERCLMAETDKLLGIISRAND